MLHEQQTPSASPLQSLYVHWPFCPYKCHFCPFVALAGHEAFMERYHAALCKEIQIFGAHQPKKARIETIFMGGGTPSTYPPHLLLDTFGILNSTFDILPGAEITLEVNPGTVTEEKLAAWEQAGINRLSIGVQSLNNDVLRKLNRHQSAEDVYAVIRQAESRFESLSIDLILGLPGVTADEWKSLVHEVSGWPINHISVYFLTVHEDTPLYFGVKKKTIVLPTDDMMVDLYEWTIATLAAAGFEQYEISNFARAGYRSRHNTAYWSRIAYKGFGMGACSFDGAIRSQNTKSLMPYLEALEQGQLPQATHELLTAHDVWLEKLMLGLRQTKGIAYTDIIVPLTEQQKEYVVQQVTLLTELGLVHMNNGNLLITPKGRAVENEIIVKLSLV